MSTFSSIYLGELRVKSTHDKSGVEIITDAPVDNHGKGESFSPTDLLCTSLASCMITLMGISANGHSIDLSGLRTKTYKFMESNPRRVGKIRIEIDFQPNLLTEKQKEVLKHAALTCPVYLSLHPDIEKDIVFNW
jgi:uncharacterized OsmC-like protein